MSSAQSSEIIWESDEGPLNPLGLFSSGEVERETEWNQRLLEVFELNELEENWDGDGAEAINTELINSAHIYLIKLYAKGEVPPPARVIASQDGEIIIEWQSDDIYLEASISEPYHAEWMCVYEGRPPVHWEDEWRSQAEEASPFWSGGWSTEAGYDEKPSYLWEEYAA